MEHLFPVEIGNLENRRVRGLFVSPWHAVVQKFELLCLHIFYVFFFAPSLSAPIIPLFAFARMTFPKRKIWSPFLCWHSFMGSPFPLGRSSEAIRLKSLQWSGVSLVLLSWCHPPFSAVGVRQYFCLPTATYLCRHSHPLCSPGGFSLILVEGSPGDVFSVNHSCCLPAQHPGTEWDGLPTCLRHPVPAGCTRLSPLLDFQFLENEGTLFSTVTYETVGIVRFS